MLTTITFTADARLIEAARQQAAAENSSLDEQFLRWLEQYAHKRQVKNAMVVVDRIAGYADSGGQRFTRDEGNERRGPR